jgi:hypothetical protein
VKWLLALVVVFMLSLGMAPAAMAHSADTATHQATAIQSVKTDVAPLKVEALKSPATKCPCKSKCSTCACSMASCCQALGKNVQTSEMPEMGGGRSNGRVDRLAVAMRPRAIAEPPQHI